jgi:hypothetical protein
VAKNWLRSPPSRPPSPSPPRSTSSASIIIESTGDNR